MTYCVAVSLDQGLVFASDSRTNAGVDQLSAYSKMHTFGLDGVRQFVLLSAGNLATTQAVVTQIRRDMDQANIPNLCSVEHMSDAAEYLGALSRNQQVKQSGVAATTGFSPEATFILGGQISGQPHALFLIYPEGNYITAPEQSPYLQIGESKYGKPILDRIIEPGLSLEDAARCALVSMDSTMHSNATVGPPVDLLLYQANTLLPGTRLSMEEEDEYYRMIRAAWADHVKQAFASLPRFDWELSPAPPPPQPPVV